MRLLNYHVLESLVQVQAPSELRKLILSASELDFQILTPAFGWIVKETGQ